MVVRGARFGIAALLAMVLASALGSGQPLAAASRGDGWTRVDMRRAFGPRVHVSAIVHAGPGFVAVGSRRDPGHRAFNHSAVWTSSDGEHWDRTRGLRFRGGRFPGFAQLVEHHGVLVTSTDGTELWRSTDAKTWRLVDRVGRSSREGTGVTVGPRGFVAITSGPFNLWNSPVSTSADGRTWQGVEQNGTAARPVGLFPDVPLGVRWLSVGPSINSAPPTIYASSDGAHWSPIAQGNVPRRLGAPMAGNHRHTLVLGIEYEPVPGGFGGRLWSSRDARIWTEIASFHRQLPVANPDHIVQSGRWWVVGGNTGTPDGLRRASMWASRDLRRWYTMPKRLWGPKSQGTGVTLTSGNGRVVGLGISDHGSQLWVWTPPV